MAYLSLHTAEFLNFPGCDTRILGFQGLSELSGLRHPPLCKHKLIRFPGTRTEGISLSIREGSFRFSPLGGSAHSSVRIYEQVAYHPRW